MYSDHFIITYIYPFSHTCIDTLNKMSDIPIKVYNTCDISVDNIHKEDSSSKVDG